MPRVRRLTQPARPASPAAERLLSRSADRPVATPRPCHADRLQPAARLSWTGQINDAHTPVTGRSPAQGRLKRRGRPQCRSCWRDDGPAWHSYSRCRRSSRRATVTSTSPTIMLTVPMMSVRLSMSHCMRAPQRCHRSGAAPRPLMSAPPHLHTPGITPWIAPMSRLRPERVDRGRVRPRMRPEQQPRGAVQAGAVRAGRIRVTRRADEAGSRTRQAAPSYWAAAEDRPRLQAGAPGLSR